MHRIINVPELALNYSNLVIKLGKTFAEFWCEFFSLRQFLARCTNTESHAAVTVDISRLTNFI
ncbi:UNVERIFIED_CONTAM: hypothetical protein NCL1_16693 [Trichonephila clavipes]